MYKRQHLTCVDKANVFRTYAFFRTLFDEVTTGQDNVETRREYIDAMALHLVRQPGAFDVIVTENMFGDILSDLAASLVGGMGMAPSADIGDRHAVFQPAHGTAPDIAGRGSANPVAAILSAAMMLEYLAGADGDRELQQSAAAIRAAIGDLFATTPRTTPDLGGTMSCEEVGTEICSRLDGDR